MVLASDSGSKPEAVLPPKGHLAMFRGTFGCHNWGYDWHPVLRADGMLFNILQRTRLPLEQKIIRLQNINGAKVGEPFPRLQVEAPAPFYTMLTVGTSGSWTTSQFSSHQLQKASCVLMGPQPVLGGWVLERTSVL